MQEEPQYIDPPKLADRFFDWYCYKPLHDSISGDLYERYMDNIERYGQKRANRKYWLDVIRFMNRHTLKRSKKTSQYNSNQFAMFSNYFKVGFRNLIKNRSFTLINVLGLSVSMAVCLVIILMINDQLSYDKFQENRDKIHRFTHVRTNSKITLPLATVPPVMADRMQADFSGFDQLVRFRRGFGGEVLENGKAISVNGLFTEPSFFEMFSYQLEQGDRKTALENPNSVVLKKEVAEKLFKDQDPIGKTIELGNQGSFIVTGVLETIPGKTHIAFDALASISSVDVLEKNGVLSPVMQDWDQSSGGWVYFTLNDGYHTEDLFPMLESLEKEKYNEESEYLLDFGVQKMTNITPGPLYGNQIGTAMPSFFVYGLAILAFLIIVCAAFNYTNLSAARALTRTREVGVRKVMGARRLQLTIQFIVESVLVSLMSLLVAIGLLQILIPAFENLQMSTLLDWDLNLSPNIYLQFALFGVGVGFITGLFPSLYLSSFQPVRALKSIITNNKLSRVNLRKALIVCQFVISLILIVSSALVYKQIKYMVEKDYGYTKENIININLQGQSFDILKNDLKKLAFVEEVSGASRIPNTGTFDDLEVKRNSTDDPMDFYLYSVDETYIDNLNLSLVAGGNFIASHKDAGTKQIIINETGAKDLGFSSPLEAVSQTVLLEDSIRANILGVVKDYNFMILYMDIKPMLFTYEPEQFLFAQVKISGFDLAQELSQIEATWEAFDPNHEIDYKTFQGQIDEFNAFFYDILYIIGLVSILSISIAGMGLLGIATYSIQIRLKEVSIRKVLGASVNGLILLLSKGFLKLFALAMLIGFSIAYMGNSAWLNQFAYRVNFGLDIFMIPALAMILIGVFTIGLQALRATSANPAANLRDD